jgi:hypothetical protein
MTTQIKEQSQRGPWIFSCAAACQAEPLDRCKVGLTSTQYLPQHSVLEAELGTDDRICPHNARTSTPAVPRVEERPPFPQSNPSTQKKSQPPCALVIFRSHTSLATCANCFAPSVPQTYSLSNSFIHSFTISVSPCLAPWIAILSQCSVVPRDPPGSTISELPLLLAGYTI